MSPTTLDHQEKQFLARGEVRKLPPLGIERIGFWGVLTVMLFGPLAFGATEVWSLAFMQLAVSTLVVLWAMGLLPSGQVEVITNPLWRPLAACGAIGLMQWLFHLTVYRFA